MRLHIRGRIPLLDDEETTTVRGRHHEVDVAAGVHVPCHHDVTRQRGRERFLAAGRGVERRGEHRNFDLACHQWSSPYGSELRQPSRSSGHAALRLDHRAYDVKTPISLEKGRLTRSVSY